MRSSLAIELGGGLGAAAAPAGAARAGVAQAPGMAVLFHGDHLPPPDCGPLAVRLQQPAEVAALVQAKFPQHAVAVVMPPRYEGDFACFDGWLPPLPPGRQGVPAAFHPAGFPAASSLARLIQQQQYQQHQQHQQQHQHQQHQQHQQQHQHQQHQQHQQQHQHQQHQQHQQQHQHQQQVSQHPREPIITLLGFSKGALVLHQVLAELAEWQRQSGQECAMCTWQARQAATPPPPAAAAAADHAGQGWEAALVAVRELHWLDAGANSRGVAYPTSAALFQALALRCAAHAVGLHLHGTPRQWHDPSRRWLAQEAAAMAAAAAAAGVACRRRQYFAGQPPSLEQHFAVLQAFEPF